MVEGPQIIWLIEGGYLVDCDVLGAPDRMILPRTRDADDGSKKCLERSNAGARKLTH